MDVALTPRQVDVLRLLPEGLTTQQIASRLGIKPNTAKTTIYNMMQRTAAVNRAELVAWGFRNGVLE